MTSTEVDGTVNTNVLQFIGAQNKMNGEMQSFMDRYTEDKTARDKQQQDTMLLLQKILEKNADAPPAKKPRTEVDGAIQGSSQNGAAPAEATSGSDTGGKEKMSTSAEVILSSADNGILDVHVRSNDLMNEEDMQLLNKLAGNGDETTQPEATEEDEIDLNNMTEDQLEAYLCSEYSDMLSQTEEKFGPPVSQALGVLCERLWGKILLSQEKKKALQEGLDIPANCKALKAPKVNSAIYIRLKENAMHKDDAAKVRQINMAKAAIPILYSLGEMDRTKAALEAQAKFLSLEPKTLDDAKKMLQTIKTKNEVALTSVNTSKSKASKVFQLLNYNCTETTRKRRQDICNDLGTAFKPYGLETAPPTETLFDEDQMKRMKSDLKNIKPKAKEQQQFPKTGPALQSPAEAATNTRARTATTRNINLATIPATTAAIMGITATGRTPASQSNTPNEVEGRKP